LRDGIADKTRELVALAKEGNESAISQLWTVYGARVHWIMRLRMGKELRSKLESTDLAQDTLLSALGDLENFTYKNEGDFLRWISTIAENRLRDNLDKLHADKRNIRKEIRLGKPGANTVSKSAVSFAPIEATTPSVIMSRKEELDKLEKAIDKLKPEYKEVIVLSKIEGLSYKEIADTLGKTSEAVRKLISRAMAALTTVFDGD
jgi:RNA polymerase sigma-70 factor (ECF subfamily)